METSDSNTAPRPPAWKRRTILIKKGLQLKYMALIFFSVLVGFLIVGLEVSWNLSRLLNDRPALIQPVMDELGAVWPVSLLKMTLYLVIVLIVSSVISHRMAGPIFKFEKTVGTLAGGDLTHRVFLRKGDQFMDLQDELNSMAASLQEKLKTDRGTAENAALRLRGLAARAPDAQWKSELEKTAEELSRITSEFKL